MNKFDKFWRAASLILRKPSLLNLILTENSVQKQNHLKKYPEFEALPQIRLQDLKPNFNVETETFFLDGSSMQTDLALLKILAEGKKNYFEIGTWRGESVWNVAKIVEDCTTLNLSTEEMKQKGWNPKYAELHGILSKKNPRIRHLEGDTSIFDFGGLQQKFDLVFIDGDHTYEMVKNDTEKIFAHLLHENSIVVWHDYAYNPEKVRYEVFSAILDALPKEKYSHLYHVANTMCAVFIKGNFVTQKFESPKNPDRVFRVQITE